MDNVRELVTLTRSEMGGLINLLVEYNKRIDVVKTQFQQIYIKNISPQTIKLVLTKHEIEINQLREAWQNSPDTQDLFHLTERLKRWNDLYELALKPDAVQVNVKYDPHTYDVIGREDLKSAANILKGAAWDVHMSNKLKLEAKKIGALVDTAKEPEEEEVEDRGRAVSGW